MIVYTPEQQLNRLLTILEYNAYAIGILLVLAVLFLIIAKIKKDSGSWQASASFWLFIATAIAVFIFSCGAVNALWTWLGI